MRRFFTLVCLLCLAIPAGISISGCTRNPGANYCNGLGYGLKITDVASIDLEPRTTGISLAFGRTQQVTSPTAKTCKGDAASVSTYAYGTTNNQLVDISPSGSMCAGTWNRNSGGGISDFTICRAPNPIPSTNGQPFGTAFITASANAVSSNPVQVFVHAQVTSISLVGPTSCLSQTNQSHLDAQACYSSTVNPTGQAQNVLMCAPSSVTTASNPSLACPLPYTSANGQFTQVSLASIPACTTAIGTLSYSVANSAVATINSETNQITAEQPGTTEITASVAGSGSSAGYFSTCPPASIQVTLNGVSGTTNPVTVTQGVTQNLVTSVKDTAGASITGLTLDYQSTNPVNISAGSAGAITTSFPGQASIYAVCQPPTCNPSPSNQVGLNGTGLSISSNPVAVTTPGTASAYIWLAAPGQSQYFVPVELLTGTVGSTVRMPYVPNSMVMDQLGTNLYFGSSHALMIYSTSNNTLSKTPDTSVPGVVLAVSPNNQQLLINDQARQLFYIYNASGSIAATFGGMGNAAAWTPDSKTLYITDNAALNDPSTTPPADPPLVSGHSNTLYVYNTDTGWRTYPNLPLPSSPLPSGALSPDTTPANARVSVTDQTPALTIPGVGAYLRGADTTAHTWCPSGTVGNDASMIFYPQGDAVTGLQSDTLAATADGKHILSAAFVTGGGITLNDIGVTVPSAECPISTSGTVQTLSALPLTHTTPATVALAKVANATAVNRVVASPVSNLAFITYTGGATSGSPSVPYYVPGSGVNYAQLMNGTAPSTTATAPLAGAFSPDDTLFFVSTAGDNQIHYFTLSPSAPPKDTQQITPNLPVCTVGSDPGCFPATPNSPVVPATVIAVKPRSTT